MTFSKNDKDKFSMWKIGYDKKSAAPRTEIRISAVSLSICGNWFFRNCNHFYIRMNLAILNNFVKKPCLSVRRGAEQTRRSSNRNSTFKALK